MPSLYIPYIPRKFGNIAVKGRSWYPTTHRTIKFPEFVESSQEVNDSLDHRTMGYHPTELLSVRDHLQDKVLVDEITLSIPSFDSYLHEHVNDRPAEKQKQIQAFQKLARDAANMVNSLPGIRVVNISSSNDIFMTEFKEALGTNPAHPDVYEKKDRETRKKQNYDYTGSPWERAAHFLKQIPIFGHMARFVSYMRDTQRQDYIATLQEAPANTPLPGFKNFETVHTTVGSLRAAKALQQGAKVYSGRKTQDFCAGDHVYGLGKYFPSKTNRKEENNPNGYSAVYSLPNYSHSEIDPNNSDVVKSLASDYRPGKNREKLKDSDKITVTLPKEKAKKLKDLINITNDEELYLSKKDKELVTEIFPTGKGNPSFFTSLRESALKKAAAVLYESEKTPLLKK